MEKEMSWPDFQKSARDMRNRFSNMCKKFPTNFTFRNVQTESGMKTRLYFLTVPQHSRETTLVFADLPQDISELPDNRVMPIYPLLESTYHIFTNVGSASREEQLQWERKRQMSWGIMSYEICVKTGKFIYPSSGSIFTFEDSGRTTASHFPLELKMTCQGARLNPQICPSNPDLITYSCNGDIWIQDTNLGWDHRLTFSHKGGKSLCDDPIISGMPSYVTQEEFHRFVGAWWCPKTGADQTYRLLYEEVDESDVEILYFASQTDQSVEEFRFPRAGTPNARSTLKLIQFQTNESGQLVNICHQHLRDRLELHFPWLEYLVRIGWTDDGNFVWAQGLDRRQVHTELILIPVSEFVSPSDIRLSLPPTIMVISHEVTEDNWINVHEIIYFLSSSKPNTLSFIWASEETGYRHLYLITVEINSTNSNHILDIYNRVRVSPVLEKVALTNGDWEVLEKQISVDEEHRVVYFTGLHSGPLERHLYVVSLDKPGDIRQLTAPHFSHSIDMDKDCTKFVTVYSNISQVPVCEVLSIHWLEGKKSIHDLQVKSVGYLFEPSEPDENYRQPELFVHQLSSSQETLYCMIFTPPNLQPNKKYPTVLSVYGGPEVQLVNNSFKGMRFLRNHMLAIHGYVVVVIDGRGSRNRGIKFEAYIKNKMGTVEIADQVEVLQSIANRISYIDMNRVAINGWSYGGYLALMGLVQRPDIFKLAIAGAPVTTWKLYDTAYTERYMDLPSRNSRGYHSSSVISYINFFPNEENRLLIVHGMSDENVHFAHTSQLINAIVRAGKPYQLQVYPNERHSLCHVDASEHYESSLLSFLKQHL